MRRQDESALGLSFLDIICGGFGASLFLFIIFASLPIESSSGLSGSNQYVFISAEWDDPYAVLDLRIQRPDGKTIRVNNPAYELGAGSSRLRSPANSIDSGAWKAFHIFGVDPIGENYARNLRQVEPGSWLATGRSLTAQILGPCPGTWNLTLDYVNRSGQQGWFTDISNDIRVDVSIYSSEYDLVLERPFNVPMAGTTELRFDEEQSNTSDGTFVTGEMPSEDYTHCQ